MNLQNCEPSYSTKLTNEKGKKGDNKSNLISPLNMVLDRISLTFDDKENVKQSVAFLIDLKNSGTYPGMQIVKTTLFKCSARIPIPTDTGLTKVVIEADPYQEKTASFRIDFNPAKLDELGFGQFYELVTTVIYGGFETAFFFGKITRIDVAFDFADLCLEDVLVQFPMLRKRVLHFTQGGRLQSLHLGATNASRIVLYDKKTPEFGHVLRLERRINPGCPGKYLHTIGSPLGGLKLLRADLVKKTWVGGTPRPFVDSVMGRGFKNAIKFYPPATQKRLKAATVKPQNLIFTGDGLWEAWPELLEEALSQLLLENPLNTMPLDFL